MKYQTQFGSEMCTVGSDSGSQSSNQNLKFNLKQNLAVMLEDFKIQIKVSFL